MNKHTISRCILALTDFISLSIIYWLSGYIVVLLGKDPAFSFTSQQLMIHNVLALGCVLYFWIHLRHYTYYKPFWFELKDILRTIFAFSIIELAIFNFIEASVHQKLWLFTWLLALICVPLFRISVKNFLIHIKMNIKDTVIIGSGRNAFDAYLGLKHEKYLGLNLVAFIYHECINENIKSLNLPLIDSKVIDFGGTFHDKDIQIIVAMEDDQDELKNDYLRILIQNNYRFISVIPTVRGLPLYGTDLSFLFSHEVMILRINNNLAKRSSQILKRVIDIIGSIILIILLSPVLFYLYWTIKKDGGNAIYVHSRVGQNGKMFDCLKFRSMVLNSKELLEELLENDPEARAEWEKDFKLKNDPRITKVGAFIRKTSLDELPQLFNVLKGEMSLVGPRPIVKEELERYHADVDYYLMAKPGMTGLWQVSGRNDVDYETRVYFDSWYVKNWSLWNDFVILCKTCRVVFQRAGAY